MCEVSCKELLLSLVGEEVGIVTPEQTLIDKGLRLAKVVRQLSVIIKCLCVF